MLAGHGPLCSTGTTPEKIRKSLSYVMKTPMRCAPLPRVIGEGKIRLSKRHGAMLVTAYRNNVTPYDEKAAKKFFTPSAAAVLSMLAERLDALVDLMEKIQEGRI